MTIRLLFLIIDVCKYRADLYMPFADLDKLICYYCKINTELGKGYRRYMYNSTVVIVPTLPIRNVLFIIYIKK